MKIVEAIKKFLAKEFLWAFVALLLAFLLTLITKWALGLLAPGFQEEALAIGFTEVEYYLIIYVFYVIVIYLVRMIVNAITTLKKEEKEE